MLPLNTCLSAGPPPPPADDRFSTLRGLDQSLNPQLNRYAHETDYLIGQARAEGRLPVFQLYPDIQVGGAPAGTPADEPQGGRLSDSVAGEHTEMGWR